MESFKEVKSQYKFYWMIGLISLLLVLIYYSTLAWIYKRYIEDETYYSHGFLVPLVTLFLIWLKSDKLKTINWEYNYTGLLLIIFSLLLHFIGTLAQVFSISGFSLFLLIIGICLFLLGKPFTKQIMFALVFLIFMFPLPIAAINIISLPMKMFIIKSIFLAFKATNAQIINVGFQLYFPKGSLIVDNSCAGVRSLIVIMALGSLFAYFLNASKVKKALLFMLSIPIAFISNLIRVFLLSLIVYFYGEGPIKGFLHNFTGYLVFVIAFIGLWFFWRAFQCKSPP